MCNFDPALTLYAVQSTVSPSNAYQRLNGIQALAKKRTEPVDFETALNELEGLVEKMEQGDISLEASLAAFERGIQLTRTCQEALSQAEQKVEQLLTQNGTEQITPFDSNDA